MTIEELKDRMLEYYRGEFRLVADGSQIRHPEITDCIGKPGCPILVCLGQYKDADENRYAESIGLKNGLTEEDTRKVIVSSDHKSALDVLPFRRRYFKPDLRVWMLENLVGNE